jgi:hypothetical protein
MNNDTRRLSDDMIEATYGTRMKYRNALVENIGARKAQTYEAYKAGADALSLGTMSAEQWATTQAAAIAELRAVLAANR